MAILYAAQPMGAMHEVKVVHKVPETDVAARQNDTGPSKTRYY